MGKTLNNETKLTLVVVITLLGAVFASGGLATTVWSHDKRMDTLEIKSTTPNPVVVEKLNAIDKRLERIERLIEEK